MQPSKEMIMACVLAHLKAEGRETTQLSAQEYRTLVNQALADLRFAQGCIGHKSE